MRSSALLIPNSWRTHRHYATTQMLIISTLLQCTVSVFYWPKASRWSNALASNTKYAQKRGLLLCLMLIFFLPFLSRACHSPPCRECWACFNSRPDLLWRPLEGLSLRACFALLMKNIKQGNFLCTQREAEAACFTHARSIVFSQVLAVAHSLVVAHLCTLLWLWDHLW